MWRRISNTDFDLLVNAKRKKNDFDYNIDPEIPDEDKFFEINQAMKYIKGGLNQSKREQLTTNNEQFGS
jgi:hypothetical protein